MKCRIIAVLGTRPEAIKLASVGFRIAPAVGRLRDRLLFIPPAIIADAAHGPCNLSRSSQTSICGVIASESDAHSLPGRVLEHGRERTCHIVLNPPGSRARRYHHRLLPRRWRLLLQDAVVIYRSRSADHDIITRFRKKPTGAGFMLTGFTLLPLLFSRTAFLAESSFPKRLWFPPTAL